MITSNQIQIAAPFDTLFQIAADIAHWPDILPHYRWVKILNRQGQQVIAEMAARHKGIPLWWKTIQTRDPDERRIHFTHIGGITKGMEVDWIMEEASPPGACPVWHVQIVHDFHPHWPPGGRWFAEKIIGDMFVHQVAGKTLKRMKELLEAT